MPTCVWKASLIPARLREILSAGVLAELVALHDSHVHKVMRSALIVNYYLEKHIIVTRTIKYNIVLECHRHYLQ